MFRLLAIELTAALPHAYSAGAMNRSKWFFHPILIFVFSNLALGLSLFLFIYWYIEISAGLESVMRRFNLDRDTVLSSDTWVVILVLSILVGLILLGIFIIFSYSQKTLQLYRLQHNFINSFTHELKTPVTSLKLYLETFLKYDLSRDDQRKYTRYMISDVARLSENINQILSLAKIESKSYEGKFIRMDLEDTIQNFFSKNSYLFPSLQVNLHSTGDGRFPVRINPSLFEMLLMNLANNSIKYNRADVPELSIHLERKGSRIHCTFRDNGIGFDSRERKKIFKKFYRVGKTDDMSAKGSGLGLYLVQHIAKIHKGSIAALSDGIGTGAVFYLKLPFRKRYSR